MENVLLILSLPIHLLKIGLERLGKVAKNQQRVEQKHNNHDSNCTVLFPTNGVGFGHFTRMYALAKGMKKTKPKNGNYFLHYYANITHTVFG